MTIDFLVKKIEIDKQAFYQFKSSSSGCDKSIEFFSFWEGGRVLVCFVGYFFLFSKQEVTR